MIIPPRIANKHSNVRPYIEAIKPRVREVLTDYCEGKGYAFLSRIKTIDSIAEKIETGRYQSWSDLDDLFACTIIIPSLLEEEQVIQYLESVFEKVALRKRGTTLKSPDVFRFDATRFIGRLILPAHLDKPTPVHQIQFEVQIRTAFEHAWSIATHALTYKGEKIDWRLLRLTAQMKAAVEQLDYLILGFEESAQLIQEQTWPEVEARRTIAEFFKHKVQEGAIPDELTPKDWTRFSDNFFNLLRSSSWADGKRPERIIREGLEKIELALGMLSPASVPRSISLLQISLGILTDAGLMAPPLRRFYPLITPELETLYPSVKNYSSFFEYDK